MFAEELQIFVANALCEDRLTLEKTKRAILQNQSMGESTNPADVKLIETYYMKALLECARVEAEQFFDAHCQNKAFVKDFVAKNNQLSTVREIREMCESTDYLLKLEENSHLVDKYDLTVFVKNLKAYLWRKILDSAKNSFQEVEMMQYLTPIEINIMRLNDRSIVEIIGGVICMSKEVPKIEKTIQGRIRNEAIDEVRFIALYMFEIDCDLENALWRGVNVLVMAARVHVSKKCKWDLSGKDSKEDFEGAAPSGSSPGEDGQDGRDGYSGESSGNVMMLADEIDNSHNLTIILNGGNGSSGQDAGNGAKGKNGEGISTSKLKLEYPSPIRFLRIQDMSTLFNKIRSKGTAKIVWKNNPNRYIEVELNNGQKIIYSISRYFCFQCYLLYKGSKGGAGGRGGLNGLGGDGGFEGECTVVTKDKKQCSAHITSKKGSKGEDGQVGQTGEYGKNGWDVGYTDYKFWSQIEEFGNNQNQRLTMDYSTSSSGRVYCGYRYDGLNCSTCYATIKSSVLEHRILNEKEISRESRKEGERRKEAKATRKSLISKKAMRLAYKKYFAEGDDLINTVSEMHSEMTMNFNLMQRTAKQAFEEVESLKERSREKVSRYRIYEVTKNVKIRPKQPAKMKSSSPGKLKLVIKDIVSNPSDTDTWTALLKEEFTGNELKKLETYFSDKQQHQTEIPEIVMIKQKFGLTKFRESIDENIPTQTNSDDELVDDYNSGIFLKVSDTSHEDLDWLLDFQRKTFQNTNIQDTFLELRQNYLPSADLAVVKTKYEDLRLIKINGISLEEVLQLCRSNNDDSCACFGALRANKAVWNKLLEVFGSFSLQRIKSTGLMNKVPDYKNEILDNNEKVLQYICALFYSLKTLIISNNTLATIVEWLVIENSSCKTCCPRLQQYVQFEKEFTERKEKLLNHVLSSIQSLSNRLSKPSWQVSHEYPTFYNLNKPSNGDSEHVQEVDPVLLKGLYDLCKKKHHEVINWHSKVNTEILDICQQEILSKNTIAFAPLLELIAWKFTLQVRVYEKNELDRFIYCRKHFIDGEKIINILITDNETVENLVVDQNLVELEISRQKLISKFQSIRWNEEYLLPHEAENSNDKLIVYKICQYYDQNELDDLDTRLEKLTDDYLGRNSILSSLLHCFTCDGCHLDESDLVIIVNTVLECCTYFNTNPELFSYIILAYSQYHYIDELVLIKFENAIRRKLHNKKELRNLLKAIQHTSVKILILKKLPTSELAISEEDFSNILRLLPCINDDTTSLNQLDLLEWASTLKEAYWQDILRNIDLDFNDENLKLCVFYLVKLQSLYGNKLVKQTVDIIKEARPFSVQTLLIFVYRFYAEDMELCEDILNDFAMLNSILKSKLPSLFSNSNVRYTAQEILNLSEKRKSLSRNDYSHIRELMTKLGLSESKDRNIDQLVGIMTKSRETNGMSERLLKIQDLLKQTDVDKNEVLKFVLKKIPQNKKTSADEYCRDENKFRAVINILRSNIDEIKKIQNCNYFILDIINHGIRLKRDFGLRDTQKLVVMLMLINERSLLSQVATGEGKTLIITVFCIVKCLYGETLDIVTSCSVLAKRDAESDPPKGNKDLYELFGICVGHICSEDIDQRAQTFNRCNVVYGDLSSFQRDYLLDRFYGKNILGKRNFENVIVDEVDSMLLDNGNNMLYLSHDIANMEKLQSLFIFIWKCINQPINSSDDLSRFYDNTAIKQLIIADLYGMITRDQIDENVWQVLFNKKVIGEDGRVLMKLKDYTTCIRQLGIRKKKIENRVIFLLNTIVNRQRFIKVPPDLYAFIEHHLDKFIDNAKNALFMNEGVDYVIDVDRTGLDPDLNPKVIIIDKNTGTDQSSSQWHEGLHQFLQIKHGCKLSLMSLKAVFISNVSYLKLYQNLYGLSGTLGSSNEKKLLNELYNIDLIKIPTSKPKNFFEEKPIITGYNEQWTQNIYDETRKKIIQRRSVLIICETVKDVDHVSKYFIKRATEDAQMDPNNTFNEALKKPYIYKREHEQFTFGQGNEFLRCGKIIIATNLAGRGTDIKLEPELIKKGGLHVIATFLPSNCRIEEQAYGRAARCGEHGSGQLIIIGSDEDGGSYSSKIFQLKNVRDIDEFQRLKTIKNYYDEKIAVEERCFKRFQKHYEDLRQSWTNNEVFKEIEKLLLDSFLDKWAFWLDKHSLLIETQTSSVSNKDRLYKNLTNFLATITCDSQEWLDSPSQLLKLGNHYSKKGMYNNAEKYYNRIISNYEYYLPEALYYKSFIAIKRKTSSLLNKCGADFQVLKKDLLMAKRLFEDRINDCSNDQATVESFKRKEIKSLIHVEAFSEQQKNMSQIYSLFINSIDDILGHSVMHTSFVNADINEIFAYDIFSKLIEVGILTKPQTCKPYKEEALIDLTIEYGISKDVLEKLSRQLQQNDVIDNESLAKIIDLPNVEEFWALLKDCKILRNEIEFIVINDQHLAMIDSDQLKELIKLHKIDPECGKAKPYEIFQYPINAYETCIICKIECYNKIDSSLRRYLEDRHIIFKNRKAEINPNELLKSREFSKFDLITLSDFEQYKIPTEDGIAIFEILSRSDDGILKEIRPGKYRLKAPIDCSALPQCYQDVVAAILNSKFSYRLAYENLKMQYNEIRENKNPDIKLKLQLQLISSPHKQVFYDLIDRSIIEDVQVNCEQLKRNDLTNVFQNFTQTYAKNHNVLLKKDIIEFIKKTLEELRCGIQKYETPDCFFSSLEQTLKTQQNSCIVEASWFSLNGLENLINLEEQRYSWKFWRNFAIVVVLGISQIVAGAALEILTNGLGTYAASFLINEGVSDLFFAVGSLFSGRMTMAGYWEHKKYSMAMSAATCMIGGILARGRVVSRIGHKVAGPAHSVGGKNVAQMVGTELIGNVGGKAVAKETMKRIGCKILEGVAYGAAQGAVDHIVANYMNSVCDAIRATIMSDLDQTFHEHQLNTVMMEAYKTLGETQANLLMGQVTRECFDSRSIMETMRDWYKRIYGVVTGGIGEAMRKIGKTGSVKSLKAVLSVLKTIQHLSNVQGFIAEVERVKTSAENFLNRAVQNIQETIEEKKSSQSTTFTEPTNINTLCEGFTKQWKDVLIETSNQAIANQIIAPLMTYGANQLINFAAKAIKSEYYSMKETKYQEKFDSLKKGFDDKTKNEQIKSNEHKKELEIYHANLMKLLAKTRNPKLFANILRENVPMDMVCAQACTHVLHKFMSEINISDDRQRFTGISISIQSQDGSSHKYSSSRNPSHSITIQLVDNHFVVSEPGNGDLSASKNNCLFQVLVNKYPRLKEVFADGEAFRTYVSNYIEQDRHMSHIVAQGWHKFSIAKGNYGGAIKEEKFDSKRIFDKLLENTGKLKQELIRKYRGLPHGSDRIFEHCIKEIKKAAQEKGRSEEDTIKRINEIKLLFTENLTRQLRDGKYKKFRKDFKTFMTDFGNRVSQSLTSEYLNNLQKFQEIEECANLPRSSFVVVHPTDRVDFTQDDIKLDKLVGKGMKLSENPDIIAGVIHAELNKTLPEEDRRFNTVAIGIHGKTVYVAMNQIKQNGNNQVYGIPDDKCTEIRNTLINKNLLAGREEIVFITTREAPQSQAECRAPHAEMQILKFFEAKGILQEKQDNNPFKRIRIGASKPACLCCSTAMTSHNILHKLYAKANTNPVNWKNPSAINVQVQTRLHIRRSFS